MAQLPYINLPQSQAPGIIGDIGDSLVAAAQRKQQNEQQAAKMLLERQRLEADQARMRAEESRAQAEEHRAAAAAAREEHQHAAQQAAATAGALPQIHEALASGDQGTADALAQAHGIKLQQRPLAPLPGAAPQEPQQPMAGPLETPEGAGARAVQESFQGGGPAQDASQPQATAQQGIASQEAERQQYAQALADHPRLVAEHKAHVDAYQQAKANPVFDIETPYGKSTFDLGAERQHRQAQQEETAGTLSQGLPPQYALRAAALVKSGLTPTDASKQIEAQMRADEDRQMRGDIAGGRNQTALAVANLRKKAGGGGPAAPGSKAYVAEEKGLASELTKYEAQHKLTGKDSISEHQHDLTSALEIAKSPGVNGVDQLKVMDKMIRAATGLGVRNQTLATYREHMGGVAARGENALNEWANGAAGKAAWQNVINSVQNDLGQAQKRGGEENKAYWDMVGSSPAMQRHQDLVKRRERGAFGGMAGYGGQGEQKPAPVHSDAPVGEVKTLPDGRKMHKVGPNQWEPVQ